MSLGMCIEEDFESTRRDQTFCRPSCRLAHFAHAAKPAESRNRRMEPRKAAILFGSNSECLGRHHSCTRQPTENAAQADRGAELVVPRSATPERLEQNVSGQQLSEHLTRLGHVPT